MKVVLASNRSSVQGLHVCQMWHIMFTVFAYQPPAAGGRVEGDGALTSQQGCQTDTYRHQNWVYCRKVGPSPSVQICGLATGLNVKGSYWQQTDLLLLLLLLSDWNSWSAVVWLQCLHSCFKKVQHFFEKRARSTILQVESKESVSINLFFCAILQNVHRNISIATQLMTEWTAALICHSGKLSFFLPKYLQNIIAC